jgi:hypothetical protein
MVEKLCYGPVNLIIFGIVIPSARSYAAHNCGAVPLLRDVKAAAGGGIRFADGGDKAETCNGAVLLPFCSRR